MAGTITQRFRRNFGAADGTDFFVTLPVAEIDDSYGVFAEQIAGASILPPPLFLDVAGGDRTTTQFRVVVAAPYLDGSTVEFIIARDV